MRGLGVESGEGPMRSTKPLAVVIVALLLSFTGAAGAQTKAAQSDPIYYHFDDDFMVGDTLDTTPALLKVRPKVPRITLLRPRASFVVEMLKSVEGM
jgi:hypothetical protein